MIMSRERKFVFIEVPKTGTSAVSKRLLELDPTLERDVLYLPDGREKQACATHIAASEVRQALGHTAKEYCFIAFLRDPEEQVMSKYYFYRNGRVKEKILEGSATFGRVIRHMSALFLPIQFWILVYPFKGSAFFVEDKQGALCVDVVGNFCRLGADFRDIFSQFGYREDELFLKKTNVSSYDRHRGSLLRWFLGLSLRIHAPRDQKLYRRVLSTGRPFYNTTDYRPASVD